MPVSAPKREAYWHRPIVVTDMRTRLGDVIGRLLRGIAMREGQSARRGG